ncbi:PRC-barrel domain-containing protein [Halobacillus sp. Nhm2S1]|uniref:PRC-barrel domain-containing protein n=1 Tax=Halobacillus sp. Nhm2S1 TaxID=2866716 RepID=UPI001C7343A1|nr:PRC-barrel domain-containing protein [Halobacillus sp. Nhm2S1]MBX0358878.1 PRC-barrel domain-containing protein [Halobacillus sp. Nhm2S1]
MKKSVEIIGFPIISISAGEEIGKVKSIVINPEKGSVDFLTVEHEDWQVSVKAIPFQKIIGIGEYAITVESSHSILDLNEIPIANQLINKKVSITGARVMTRVGELVGEITEYYVNETNGQVISVDVSTAEQNNFEVSSEYIITYGENLIILNEEFPTGDVETREVEKAPAQVESKKTLHFSTTANQERVDELDRKQDELLEGKQATKNIVNSHGETVVTKGAVLTKSEIDQLKQYGPSVMVELSMNVK